MSSKKGKNVASYCNEMREAVGKAMGEKLMYDKKEKILFTIRKYKEEKNEDIVNSAIEVYTIIAECKSLEETTKAMSKIMGHISELEKKQPIKEGHVEVSTYEPPEDKEIIDSTFGAQDSIKAQLAMMEHKIEMVTGHFVDLCAQLSEIERDAQDLLDEMLESNEVQSGILETTAQIKQATMTISKHLDIDADTLDDLRNNIDVLNEEELEEEEDNEEEDKEDKVITNAILPI